VGELDRREGWRAEGATSLRDWIVERCGVSDATARHYAQVAERAWDLPHLSAALSDGQISFDKLRALVGVATPENDGALVERAASCSVRELAELARATHGRPAATAPEGDTRRTLRFNDACRTVTAQLPPDSYAEVRTCLEARAKRIPSDGETPWDQRLCDGFLSLVRTGGRGRGARSPYFVVAHVALGALIDRESGRATELAGDLERGGLIDLETIHRVACDATITLAVDDDVGHTMYEGRTRREPSGAQWRELMRRDRHCRFPGCTNVTFAHAHHITPWKPDGRTDLDNLALLCTHHHYLVHSRQWTMAGNASEQLRFVGPTGRAMVSRPSPMWTAVSGVS